MLDTLRKVAIAEAVSYLLLLAATAVKHLGGTEAGVTILGPIHGVLFLAYALLIVLERSDQGWGIGTVVWMLVLGSLPFGALWVHRRYLAAP